MGFVVNHLNRGCLSQLPFAIIMQGVTIQQPEWRAPGLGRKSAALVMNDERVIQTNNHPAFHFPDVTSASTAPLIKPAYTC